MSSIFVVAAFFLRCGEAIALIVGSHCSGVNLSLVVIVGIDLFDRCALRIVVILPKFYVHFRFEKTSHHLL